MSGHPSFRAAFRTRPGLLRLSQLLSRLFARRRGGAYRPQQHYMRGGRTHGSRGLTRAPEGG